MGDAARDEGQKNNNIVVNVDPEIPENPQIQDVGAVQANVGVRDNVQPVQPDISQALLLIGQTLQALQIQQAAGAGNQNVPNQVLSAAKTEDAIRVFTGSESPEEAQAWLNILIDTKKTYN